MGTSLTDVESMTQRITEIEPNHRVELSGGVLVYCDPEHYGQVYLEADSKWKIAVGVHPKKVDKLSTKKRDLLQALLSNPRVIGLGEVGLDYSRSSPSPETHQTELKRILAHCRADKVVVLHIRGGKDDPLSEKASQDCFQIIQEQCPSQQKIHLHCFSGGTQELKLWSGGFPNCYFGVTGKAVSFNKRQQEALQRIPLERLLLETDSPHLPVLKGLHTMTPAYIGDVAARVAFIRKEPISLLLDKTRVNGERLYSESRAQDREKQRRSTLGIKVWSYF